jgi:pyridoxal phosphate enzyme (YggS family)
MIAFEEFTSRVRSVAEQIRTACARSQRAFEEVALLPVTKTQPVEAISFVCRAGLPAVGENRVQEAIAKQSAGAPVVRWELIGHLQSNKARLAAAHFDRIQSVDSEKLLVALDKAAEDQNRTLAVLLQINAGRDPAKFGAEIEDTPRLLECALSKRHLRIDGFMTIAPLSEDTAVAERTFGTLRELRDRLSAQFGAPLRELSMGMSGDLEAAIAAGSTQVRVGTALFGSRQLQTF